MEPLLQVTGFDVHQGLRAYVVVDSLRHGQAMGGTRMTGDVSLEEVAGLARKMTYKLALADIPIGGAKAGIVADRPAGPARDAALEAFGRIVRPLLHGGVYLGSDQGVSHRDRDLFFRAAGFDVTDLPCARSLHCTWPELWARCEDATGFGICEALAEAAPSLGVPERGARVVVQGVGAVGRGVATRLHAAGHRVVAVADRHGTVACRSGLPFAQVLAATDALGTIDRRRLPAPLDCSSAPEAWLQVDCDVLVLAAGGDAVRADNVDQVRAGLVVEGANAACAPEAARRLAAAGVHVLPDIAVNVGAAAVTGLVLTRIAPVDAPLEKLRAWLYADVAARIRRNVRTVLAAARERGLTLPEAAEALATERVRALTGSARGSGRAHLPGTAANV